MPSPDTRFRSACGAHKAFFSPVPWLSAIDMLHSCAGRRSDTDMPYTAMRLPECLFPEKKHNHTLFGSVADALSVLSGQ